MKKIRNGTKKLIKLLIILLVIVVAVIIVVSIVNKNKQEEPPVYEQQIIPLPNTTYSDMEVKNISMEYLKDNNETMITLEIHNTTSNKVENERFDVLWIGPNDNILGQLPTDISVLEVGEACEISVILPGDLTATKQIKLREK